MIKLDKEWSIVGDTYKWELRQEVEKTRKKKDGTAETYIGIHSWYYYSIKQCLKRYVEESLRPLDTAEKMLEKLELIEEKISEL